MYRFIPIIILNIKNQEKEAAVKYFVAQRVPSAFVIVSIIIYSRDAFNISSIIFIALIIKIGLAPVHYWIPSVIGAVSWGVCWLLSTVQKVAPIILILSARAFSPVITVFRGGLSALVGGIGGLNQTLLRVLLAYSSIGHIGWVLGVSILSKSVRIFYFLVYMLIISRIFLFLDKLKVSNGNFVHKVIFSPYVFLFFAIIFFRLGGLPPLAGFFPKLLVVKLLVENNFFFFLFFLMLGSILNLYYYLKLIFIIILSWDPMSLKYNGNLKYYYSIIYSFIFINRFLSIILLLEFWFV